MGAGDPIGQGSGAVGIVMLIDLEDNRRVTGRIGVERAEEVMPRTRLGRWNGEIPEADASSRFVIGDPGRESFSQYRIAYDCDYRNVRGRARFDL